MLFLYKIFLFSIKHTSFSLEVFVLLIFNISDTTWEKEVCKHEWMVSMGKTAMTDENWI